MNRGYTIALLSSSAAPFCRSPAGLVSVKYPSLSVLRFPAKNWYVGVASRSKGGDSGNKEASVMMDEVLYTGREKDVEAAILKVRQFWYKKFTLFAFVSALITVDGTLFLRSSFADSTVAGAKVSTAVSLAVAIALKLIPHIDWRVPKPRLIRQMEAIEQERERLKATYVNKNQGRKVIIEEKTEG